MKKVFLGGLIISLLFGGSVVAFADNEENFLMGGANSDSSDLVQQHELDEDDEDEDDEDDQDDLDDKDDNDLDVSDIVENKLDKLYGDDWDDILENKYGDDWEDFLYNKYGEEWENNIEKEIKNI